MSGAEAQSSPPALPRSTLILLSGVSLMGGVGYAGMGSVMPAIGRELGFPDFMVSAVFSLSALCGLIFSHVWARQADIRGRKPVIQIGVLGFILSMGACGVVVGIGLLHVLPMLVIFCLFLFARTFNGTMASASPPATQAYLIERTTPERRTQAIATLSGAGGLGTIIGPLVTPLMVGTPLGLAGPMIFLALAALGMLFAIRRYLPEDEHAQRFRAGRQAGAVGGPAEHNTRIGVKAVLADRAARPFLLCGLMVMLCAAALNQIIGFVVIDRVGLSPIASLSYITATMLAGSVCAVFGQWVLIPFLKYPPLRLLLLGGSLSIAGALVIVIAGSFPAVVVGYALMSLGQSFAFPAVSTGASLAVSREAQASTAGVIASMAGGSYLTTPAVLYLYGHVHSAPFILIAVGMSTVVGYAVWKALSRRKGA